MVAPECVSIEPRRPPLHTFPVQSINSRGTTRRREHQIRDGTADHRPPTVGPLQISRHPLHRRPGPRRKHSSGTADEQPHNRLETLSRAVRLESPSAFVAHLPNRRRPTPSGHAGTGFFGAGPSAIVQASSKTLMVSTGITLPERQLSRGQSIEQPVRPDHVCAVALHPCSKLAVGRYQHHLGAALRSHSDQGVIAASGSVDDLDTIDVFLCNALLGFAFEHEHYARRERPVRNSLPDPTESLAAAERIGDRSTTGPFGRIACGWCWRAIVEPGGYQGKG